MVQLVLGQDTRRKMRARHSSLSSSGKVCSSKRCSRASRRPDLSAGTGGADGSGHTGPGPRGPFPGPTGRRTTAGPIRRHLRRRSSPAAPAGLLLQLAAPSAQKVFADQPDPGGELMNHGVGKVVRVFHQVAAGFVDSQHRPLPKPHRTMVGLPISQGEFQVGRQRRPGQGLKRRDQGFGFDAFGKQAPRRGLVEFQLNGNVPPDQPAGQGSQPGCAQILIGRQAHFVVRLEPRTVGGLILGQTRRRNPGLGHRSWNQQPPANPRGKQGFAPFGGDRGP